MAEIRPDWLEDIARKNRTIGSDSANFAPKIEFGLDEEEAPVPEYGKWRGEDRVIIPDNEWHWSNMTAKPVPIPPANPYSEPSPLGAYTPAEDEYISGMPGHYNNVVDIDTLVRRPTGTLRRSDRSSGLITRMPKADLPTYAPEPTTTPISEPEASDLPMSGPYRSNRPDYDPRMRYRPLGMPFKF